MISQNCKRFENMPKVRHLLSTVLLAVIFVVCGCATGTGGGNVGGVVIDSPQKDFAAVIVGTVLHDGEAIADAQIELINYDATTTTDENGRFEVPFTARTRMGVNRLRVLVRAKKEGFRSRTRGVYVVINQQASLIIQLLPNEIR